MIDLISQDISKNNSQISALNNEQNEIKPKIDPVSYTHLNHQLYQNQS